MPLPYEKSLVEEVQDELMNVPGVVGVGQTLTAIRVYTLSSDVVLPAEIKGIPLDVVVSGVISAL